MSSTVITVLISLSAAALALSLYALWRCLRVLFGADGEAAQGDSREEPR